MEDMMKKYNILSLCCVFLVLLQLIGCSGGVCDSAPAEMEMAMDSYVYSTTSSSDMKGAAFDAEYPIPEKNAGSQESGTAQNDLSSRKIIKYAALNFETKTYDDFIAGLEQCIAELGGYIESSEAYGGGIYSSRNSRNSHIVVRIPESQYNRFMNDVCAIGTLTYKSESSDDVTMSYVDTESHIKALETEYDALIEILDKAASLDDVIQLQSRITEVTYQLDSYKAQLRKYDDLITYCTVNIDVSEVWRETQNEEVMSFGERIVSGLEETFYEIGEDLTDFSVWLITSLPYILIWAVLLTVLILLVRLCIQKIKRKKEQKLINRYMKQIDEKTDSNHT